MNKLCFLSNAQERIAWLNWNQSPLLMASKESLSSVYLGLDETIGVPYWAVDITGKEELVQGLGFNYRYTISWLIFRGKAPFF